METPNTPEGRLTERIMLRVHEKLPALPVHQYNTLWSAVYATLSESPESSSSSPLSRGLFQGAMRRRTFLGA